MGIVIPLVMVTISCLVIWRTSDGFTVASEYIGRNLSEGVRGATLNAIASSMPELLTSLFFLFFLNDADGFAGGIGTTAGSAIFNGMVIPALVILAVTVSGVTKYIHVTRKVLLRDGISLIVAELVLISLISGTELTWIHGFILTMMYLLYLGYMLFSMKKRGEKMEASEEEVKALEEIKVEGKNPFKAIITLDLAHLFVGGKKINNYIAWPLLLFSTLLMSAACLLLVLATEWLGFETYSIPFLGEFQGLNIPLIFLAVIIVSAASSVPDTIISIKDARKGFYDDAVSNALGSNIFDICFALGLPLMIFTLVNGPIEMSQEIIDLSTELRVLLLFYRV